MVLQQTDPLSPTSGLRVLVVEDNLLIAETICEMLESSGCAIIGPVSDMPSGLRLVEAERLDGALLDINLGGTLSFPLAAALSALGVPFVFMTGYAEGTIFPPEFRAIRRVSKPFDLKEVTEVLEVWGRMARH
jgi:CheY-like chemotaxis protein